MRGVLVTLEGVEGSGKSTQAERLARRLTGLGVRCLSLREPGGTEIGEAIRSILLDPGYKEMHALTELFLYLASRNQLVREKVLPALDEGKVVVLDRFGDSSTAYQGFGRELGEKRVARLNKLATADLRPNQTVLVDVPIDVGRGRKASGVLDRLERERVEFHERVREGYLRVARRAPGRIKVVDGTLPADELEQSVFRHVEELLKRKGILK
ncbi:dTMP kinase [candidate division WOR-3 bacterium]|nr:dTMP kinase [candidate division WOR-3 bacterium]